MLLEKSIQDTMLDFGFSEAEIFVGKDSILKMMPLAKIQAEHIHQLGSNVCPRIYDVKKDFYIMEKLAQPKPIELFSETAIIEIHRILKKYVHTKNPPSFDYQWTEKLKKFLSRYSDLVDYRIVDEFYNPKIPSSETCLIHGDTTLANVMLRGKQILLIDPVAPRGKIPPLREVDYGKMLQSALGWEAIQQRLPYKENQLIESVLSPIENRRIVFFWAMIHIIRILPRAQKRSDVARWCFKQIEYCTKELHA